MHAESLAFLRTLLDTPGPSSFELAPARAWRARAEKIADSVSTDVSGNSYATLNEGGNPRVMLAGHIDEIGVIVTHIDDDGFLSFEGIGGWDAQVFVGQRVQLMTKNGTVTGIIGKKAIHLMSPDDRTKVSKIDDLWIDIGATSKFEAVEQVRIGDPGVIAVKAVEFPNSRLVSRSMDNRLGAFVVLEALRLIKGSKQPLAAAVTAVATTREEIAMGGGGARTSAVSLEATAAIVVDVTHATDYPGIDKRKDGDYKLGGGPVITRGASVSNVVVDLLIEAAEAEKIPYALEAAGRDTHTDAEAIFNAHRGVATALVSIPLRYMHSPNELCALADVEHTAQLLAAFARRLPAGTDFIPR